MRSQGCPGCQKFWNFVLRTKFLVCSAKIQLENINKPQEILIALDKLSSKEILIKVSTHLLSLIAKTPKN